MKLESSAMMAARMTQVDAPSETLARRLFRACGVAPLGAFVVLHVFGYAEVLVGEGHFGSPDALRVGVPRLFVEVALVLLPLAFHGAYGLFMLARPGPRLEASKATALDRLQRWLGPPILLFVVDHFVRFRLPILEGELAESDAHALLVRELSATTLGMPLLAAGQLLGILAVAFHLAYGCYRFDWRRLSWLEPERRRVGLAIAVGLLVLLAGSLSVIGLATGKKPPFL